MRAKYINEGTWKIPNKSANKYIDELENFQRKIFDIFGDDEVHNGLDLAIKRMKHLISLNKPKTI